MAKGNNIHDEVKEQRKKLKELTFSGKIEYIWSYYKIPIIGILLAILFAGSLTYSIIRNNYDTVCFIAVLDGRITGYDDDTDALTTGLTDYLGIDGKKEQVDISYTFSLVEKEMDQEAAVTANRIYTYASTNTLDGYLSEKEYIDYFCTDRNIFFWDLRDLFSTEELNELSNLKIGREGLNCNTFCRKPPGACTSEVRFKVKCSPTVSILFFKSLYSVFIRAEKRLKSEVLMIPRFL